MIRGFTELLRGANGGIELNRVVGFVGGLAYIIGAHAYLGWDMWRGATFDLTEYCLTFPPGLAVVAGGTALAVSVKDKAVASAKVTEQTGAIPTPPPAGPRVPTDDPDRQPVPGEYGP